MKISRGSVIRFLRRFQETKSLENAAKSGRRPLGVTIELMNFIDAEMESNDELTSPELAKRILLHLSAIFAAKSKTPATEAWMGVNRHKVLPVDSEPNRVKRLQFSEDCLRENEQFNNVIFTDECSVLLENHSKLSFQRTWEQPKVKGKPKHPIEVHVWAGISKGGSTELIMFEGIMDAQFYVSEILTNGLLPFNRTTFPNGHRFKQDNDPKHTSRLASSFMEEQGINWWKTPPESPNLNPIKVLWHELKHFLRTKVKPKTKEELLDGIARFWSERVDAEKCSTYIRHLQKVLPIVVERQGKASGH